MPFGGDGRGRPLNLREKLAIYRDIDQGLIGRHLAQKHGVQITNINKQLLSISGRVRDLESKNI